MSHSIKVALVAVLSVALVAVLVAPTAAQDQGPPPTDSRFEENFETPVLGIDAIPGRNHFAVADAGQGIVRVAGSGSNLVASLPGVTDVVAVNGNKMFAITGEPPEDAPEVALQAAPPGAPQTLYRVKTRAQTLDPIVNLLAAEERFNPDGAQVHSNPFGVTRHGRFLYVADAAANAVWVATKSGKVRPVASFPSQIVPTQWLKDAVGCGVAELPPEVAELCDLPSEMPAESVPTSVAVGPDGYLYVGELVGFPAPPGSSRVWKVHPRARFAECGVSDLCEVVLEGLTSIVDIGFTSGGDLAVAEMDRATWIAAENGQGIGGAVVVCVLATGVCTDVADGLQLLTAIAVGRGDRIFAVVFGLVPGLADVVMVGRG